jgi:hypothetical protein
MSHAKPHLSRNEVLALKYAAHRQLARWAKARPLHPRQRARRTALVAAVRTLEDPRPRQRLRVTRER